MKEKNTQSCELSGRRIRSLLVLGLVSFRKGEDNLIIVYYCGHGILGHDGRLLWKPNATGGLSNNLTRQQLRLVIYSRLLLCDPDDSGWPELGKTLRNPGRMQRTI